MKTIGFFLYTAIVSVGITLTACDGTVFWRNQVSGSGKLVKANRPLQGFTGVEAGGAVDITITAQKEFGVEVEADDNIIELVKTNVVDGILHIETDDRYSFSDATVRVRVTLPDLTLVDISGASTATASELKADNLTVEVSGASKVTVEGTSHKLHGEVSGASSLVAEKLPAERVTIEASGASKGYVTATQSLTAEASGASTIYYSGNPKSLDKETSGASSIKRR
jgi:hypothetical protein